MKRLIGCLMLLCAHFIQAQEVKIKFEQLQRDLIARTQPRLDLNDNPCADFAPCFKRAARALRTAW